MDAVGRLLILQYVALTGPVYVPPAAPPTVTVDQWVAQPPPAPRRQFTHRFGTVVTPVFVPDVTTPAPSLSWQAPVVVLPARPPVRLAPTGLTVAPVTLVAPPPAAPALTPVGFPSAPRRLTARPQLVLAAPVFVPDVTHPVTPLSWRPADVRRASQWRRAVPSGSVGPVSPVVVPAPTYAASNNERVVPRRVGPRGLQASVAPLYVPDVTVRVPAGLPWNPVYPPRAFKGRHPAAIWWKTPPVLVIDPSFLPAPPADQGNLWEDIPTPRGTSPFDGTPAAGTGISPFGAPPARRGRSPWDLP